MPALTPTQLTETLQSLPHWQTLHDKEIARTFSFKNYYETMAFVNAVAYIAHQADHHPDLEVGYNRCRVRLSTHDAGGVSEKDISSAAKIDSLLGQAPVR